MKCPRTGSNLKQIKVGGIELDISEGCGGVWFDNNEIHKFTSISSRVGEVLSEHLKQFHNPFLENSARLNCPKDADVVMMRRYFSAKQQIEISSVRLENCSHLRKIFLEKNVKYRNKPLT